MTRVGSQSGQAFYTTAGTTSGYGRKLARSSKRDCQRCGKRFTATRDVPYCFPCYKAKRKESHAAYSERVAARADRKQTRCADAED